MKILFHSDPGYSYLVKEVIKFSKERAYPIEWGVILYSNSSGLLDELRTLAGKENVLYLQERLNHYMKLKETSLDELKDFPASVFECISTSKVMRGHIPLVKKDRRYQLRLITGTYSIYKKFLLANRPDCIFFSIIEGYDSLILYYLCKELGIMPVIYGHGRNIGGSYFSDSIYEELPFYAMQEDIPQGVKDRAEAFIRSFREKFKPPSEISYKPQPEDIIDTSYLRQSLLEKAVKFFKTRLAIVGIRLQGAVYEPYLSDRFTFLHNLRMHFIGLTRRYSELKGNIIYKFFYDIKDLEGLPEKFIYYPLQYTPEVSINIPSPYFIDQLRAVDLILSSMPPDYYLVIKEHPAMRGERPLSFYKALKEKANILLADFSLPSMELIKKADLTVSVTGTSCLEAFLIGKPSLHLGRAFFTDWIYRFDSLSEFKNIIKQATALKEVPMEKIIDLVARVFIAGEDFILFCPGMPGATTELLMNKANINKFLEGLLRHIERMTAR